MERQDADPALKPALMQFDMALAEFARARKSDPKASSLSLLERTRIRWHFRHQRLGPASPAATGARQTLSEGGGCSYHHCRGDQRTAHAGRHPWQILPSRNFC